MVKQLFTMLNGRKLAIITDAGMVNSIRDDDNFYQRIRSSRAELEELGIPCMVPLQPGDLTSIKIFMFM